METSLKEMFPTGEWGLGQKSWMVKDGVYFCAVADIVDGKATLTELGHRLVGTTGDVILPSVEAAEIPTFVNPKPELPPKKTGLKAKHG